MPPNRMRKPAASIYDVEQKISVETTEVLDPWPRMLDKPMNWNEQTSGRRHPRVGLENKKAAATMDAVQQGLSQVQFNAETSIKKSQVASINALPHGSSQEPTNAETTRRKSQVASIYALPHGVSKSRPMQKHQEKNHK